MFPDTLTCRRPFGSAAIGRDRNRRNAVNRNDSRPPDNVLLVPVDGPVRVGPDSTGRIKNRRLRIVVKTNRQFESAIRLLANIAPAPSSTSRQRRRSRLGRTIAAEQQRVSCTIPSCNNACEQKTRVCECAERRETNGPSNVRAGGRAGGR